MEPTAWIAVAGGLFTAGGLIWGHGWGAGSSKKEMEDMSGTLKSNTAELIKVKNNLQGCQLKSAQNTTEAHTAIGIVRIDLDKLQGIVTGHFSEFIDHMQKREVHTDAEWRATILNRLAEMSTSFDNRMGTFQEVILNRIGVLENIVKNGGNPQ